MNPVTRTTQFTDKENRMKSSRITIKTQNIEEALAIAEKISRLTTDRLVNYSSISFLLLPNVKVMDLAKLLTTAPEPTVTVTHFASVTPNTKPSDLHRVTACPGVIHKSVSCNLATRIAWLEELSVVSECTGQQYCLVGPARLRYDPIARPAIIQKLIQKYHVDLDWREDGGCDVKIYSYQAGNYRATAHTSNHNGCFATTVLTVILEAQS